MLMQKIFSYTISHAYKALQQGNNNHLTFQIISDIISNEEGKQWFLFFRRNFDG